MQYGLTVSPTIRLCITVIYTRGEAHCTAQDRQYDLKTKADRNNGSREAHTVFLTSTIHRLANIGCGPDGKGLIIASGRKVDGVVAAGVVTKAGAAHEVEAAAWQA